MQRKRYKIYPNIPKQQMRILSSHLGSLLFESASYSDNWAIEHLRMLAWFADVDDNFLFCFISRFFHLSPSFSENLDIKIFHKIETGNMSLPWTGFLVPVPENTSIIACDWRVRITGCRDYSILYTIHAFNIALNLMALFTGSCILTHKYFIQKIPLWEYSDSSAKNEPFLSRWKYLKPKPIENFIFWSSIFFFLRAIMSTLVITDAIPSDVVRDWFQDVAWEVNIIFILLLIFTSYIHAYRPDIFHLSLS